MRGKDKILYLAFADVRITPAHAGKSLWNAIQTALFRDHPRSCGEKALISRCQAEM